MILSFFAPITLKWTAWKNYLRHISPERLSCLTLTVLQEPEMIYALGGLSVVGQSEGADLLYWPIRGWDWFHILQTLWWVSCGFHGLLIPRINGDQQILSADYANLKISFSLKKTSQIYWWWIKYKLLPSHNKENTAKYSRLSSHLYKLSLSIQISTNSALTPKGLSLRFFGGSLGFFGDFYGDF